MYVYIHKPGIGNNGRWIIAGLNVGVVGPSGFTKAVNHRINSIKRNKKEKSILK